jgi:hypothetical protein
VSCVGIVHWLCKCCSAAILKNDKFERKFDITRCVILFQPYTDVCEHLFCVVSLDHEVICKAARN